MSGIKEANRYVYIIQPDQGGPFKVGVTNVSQLHVRLMGVQNGNPLRLRVVAKEMLPVGQAEKHERQIHDALERWRMAGEWFDAEPEAVQALMDAAPWAVAEPNRYDQGGRIKAREDDRNCVLEGADTVWDQASESWVRRG